MPELVTAPGAGDVAVGGGFDTGVAMVDVDVEAVADVVAVRGRMACGEKKQRQDVDSGCGDGG